MAALTSKAVCDICGREYGAKGIGSHRRKCLRDKEEKDRLAAIAAVEMQRGYGMSSVNYQIAS